MTRRVAAIAALLLLATATAAALTLTVRDFPRGLAVLACTVLAAAAAWYGVTRRGPTRVAGAVLAVAFLAAALGVMAANDRLGDTVVIVALVVMGLAAARVAFAARVRLPRAPRPARPVLFVNPRSGDGKAARVHLADEARARGIEPVVLGPGDDLAALVEDAVADGADALAMAGGDGSQAVVARIAADRGVPYACIPAGTRNHFALDLGVDRDDPVGALDALVDGGERIVDLAEVNGRVFVNNVSLGLYAEAVQQPGYREAKLRTLLAAIPDAVNPPPGADARLRWAPSEGGDKRPAAAILVSNNSYRLGHAIGSGTRPRMDAGEVGVAALDGHGRGPAHPWSDWAGPGLVIDADQRVAAGIDGEAATLDPPLEFRSRPAALHARVARSHPGASPSAAVPDGPWASVRRLVQIAAGRPEA